MISHQLLLGREGDVDLEEEAVELRLGQRIGPLHLERVLGGEHEERLRQRVLLLGDGDPVLLHRLEQGALGLRGGAVDLVGKDQVAKIGPCWKRKRRSPPSSTMMFVPDDVGRHQVRRELDAAEAEVERLGEGADQHRLAEARHALQQRVAAGEQADQRLPHELVLADDEARRPRSRCAVASSAKRSGSRSSVAGRWSVVCSVIGPFTPSVRAGRSSRARSPSA